MRFAKRAEGRDRRLHLFEVGDAPVAHDQMLLDATERWRRECSFAVVRDELDELLARDLVSGHAELTGRWAVAPWA